MHVHSNLNHLSQPASSNPSNSFILASFNYLHRTTLLLLPTLFLIHPPPEVLLLSIHRTTPIYPSNHSENLHAHSHSHSYPHPHAQLFARLEAQCPSHPYLTTYV